MAFGRFADPANRVQHLPDEGLELLQAGLGFRSGPVFGPASSGSGV
jgi:hypothetical protein